MVLLALDLQTSLDAVIGTSEVNNAQMTSSSHAYERFLDPRL